MRRRPKTVPPVVASTHEIRAFYMPGAKLLLLRQATCSQPTGTSTSEETRQHRMLHESHDANATGALLSLHPDQPFCCSIISSGRKNLSRQTTSTMTTMIVAAIGGYPNCALFASASICTRPINKDTRAITMLPYDAPNV